MGIQNVCSNVLKYFRYDADLWMDADLTKDDSEETAVDPPMDSDSESEDEEFFDCLDSFEIEVEPSFTLPYNVAEESDPACVLMDKLIKELSCQKIVIFTRISLKLPSILKIQRKHGILRFVKHCSALNILEEKLL